MKGQPLVRAFHHKFLGVFIDHKLNLDKVMGAVAKFVFFFIYKPIFRKFAHKLWNWFKNNFLPTILFISFPEYRIFSEKAPFSPSTKKNRSRWVFIVHVWFTYENEAKAIMKRSSTMFFFKLSLIFFMSLLIMKYWSSLFFDNYSTQGPNYKKKNSAEKEKSRGELLFLILSAMYVLICNSSL